MQIEELCRSIPALDSEAMAAAKMRQDMLTKPRGSLGKLEELSIRIAGIKGNLCPKLKDKVIITMAGDHGVVEEGVSAYPREVTAQMVYNFISGGAGINVLARHVGARVVVVDMGVAADINNPNVLNRKINYGTKNMFHGPAMTRQEAIGAIVAGMEVAEQEHRKGMDIVGTGDMGIGNTTPSSAITAVLTDKKVCDVTGRGTGINEKMFEHKVEIIERTIELNRPDPNDPIDVLAKVGGFEIGGIVGVILACARLRIPIVLDGFISGAAALIAARLAPRARDYMIAAHCSVEKGHRIILAHLGLEPLFDLNMRLGEGTGAALGIFIIEGAIKILNDMATFETAGITDRTDKTIG